MAKTNGNVNRSEALNRAKDRELQAALRKIEELERKVKGTAKATPQISFKVSTKGAVSVYGLGRFPVTLYGGQWERLIEKTEELRVFLKDNADSLATK
jgi:hypothetical protein